MERTQRKASFYVLVTGAQGHIFVPQQSESLPKSLYQKNWATERLCHMATTHTV